MFIPHFAYPFIYWWTHWLLPCFLAIVNNAAIDTVYKYFFETLLSILLGICPDIEFLDHIIILFLISWGISILCYTVAVIVLRSPQLCIRFQFLYVLRSTYYFLFFKKKFIYFFNWRIIALQNCVGFCQTSTWVGCRDTNVPSLLNLPPTFLWNSHPDGCIVVSYCSFDLHFLNE